MATINLKSVLHLPLGVVSGAPYGKDQTLAYTFQTNSSGVIADSDSSAAVGNGDVVRLGVIPKGAKLLDYMDIISDAFTASSTGKVGFAYVDGVDDSDVPQDDDYFKAAASLASTGVARKTTVTRPVVLPKEAYLILTNAGAAQAAAGVMDILVDVELT